ncbi:class I tRNA ligase family protein [Candidatus Falkowbacteria bacterium]|nr:class I tRNA ligase family protein [Candidatus Falkowbacteria bacterium]
MDLPKAYNAKDHEDKIYQQWEKEGLFNPDKSLRKNSEPFSIILPPPNVTGTLHLGHAAMLAIEDLMVRYKRMKGFDAVWIPGTDHAAIATQNVVEKKLRQEEKKSRQDIGRKKFLEKVEKFVEESKDTIHRQLRKMGSSLDWSREAYTMDEARSRAVRKVFKMMHDDGLIYRGGRIVNWCPRCASTLADDEVDYREEEAKVYTFKYNKNFPFAIATTRPETKLGDTAVAVNPKDKRYGKYVGKIFRVNFCGVNLALKIIADRQVEMDFGTGALGVTPGHSLVDFEMARQNDLPIIKVINEDGTISEAGGKFFGLAAAEARGKIVAELKSKGLLLKEENLKHNISLCYRCHAVIEPLPSKQWFVDVNHKIKIKSQKLRKLVKKEKAGLKEMALAVVKQGAIKFIPERFEKIYCHWMENLHDWCISRQLWFGHRIPVWTKRIGQDTEIILMRHGEALSNKLNQLNSDINNQKNGLTSKGKGQARLAGKELRKEKIAVIIASNFQRTQETAQIVSKATGAPIIVDARLREVGVGEFEGKTDKEMRNFREKIGFKKWHKKSPKAVESFFKLKARVFAALDDIQKKYNGKKVLLITHGDVIRVARGYGANLSDEAIFQFCYPDVGQYVKLTIPAKEEIKVSETEIKERGWVQDADTLDTWFSSGLWSFTSMLPKNWDGKKFTCEDIERFHPTTILETGYDILPFWVARMILMTNYVMGEVPFKNVYLHGLIRDTEGDKMSKSKPETAIDPVAAGEKYGFDAVRLSLLIGNTAGNDICLYDEKIEGFRHFVNKLWNIARFILLNSKFEYRNSKQITNYKLQITNLTLADRWILSRFNKLKVEIERMLDAYNFSAAGEALRQFTWNEFADWYLEIAKVEGRKDDILFNILADLLKMWHPFTPFVTEVIWQCVSETSVDKQDKVSETSKTSADVGTAYHAVHRLVAERWPAYDKKLIDEKVETQFELLKEIIARIRNLRAEYKVDQGKQIDILFKADGQNAAFVRQNEEIIKHLARLGKTDFVTEKPEGAALSVVEKIEIYLVLSDLVDANREKERLEKERLNLEKYLVGLEKKLKNVGFRKNAPRPVVENEEKKLGEAKAKLQKINEQLYANYH